MGIVRVEGVILFDPMRCGVDVDAPQDGLHLGAEHPGGAGIKAQGEQRDGPVVGHTHEAGAAQGDGVGVHEREQFVLDALLAAEAGKLAVEAAVLRRSGEQQRQDEDGAGG
jgi:hypothetical protein